MMAADVANVTGTPEHRYLYIFKTEDAAGTLIEVVLCDPHADQRELAGNYIDRWETADQDLDECEDCKALQGGPHVADK